MKFKKKKKNLFKFIYEKHAAIVSNQTRPINDEPIENIDEPCVVVILKNIVWFDIRIIVSDMGSFQLNNEKKNKN